MAKENDLSGIDFGELIDTEVNQSSLKVEENKNVADNNQQQNGKVDEIQLDVNEVLSQKGDITETNKQSNLEENKGKDKTPAPDDNNSSSNSFALVFARFLKEQGALSDLNEEELTETFKEGEESDHIAFVKDLLAKEISNDLKKEYDEDYQNYLKLKETGISPEEAFNVVDAKSQLGSINVEDLEKEDNVELRKQLITENYKRLMPSADEKKIKRLVDGHVATGEDIEMAKEAHSDLVKFYEDYEKELIKNKQQAEIKQKQDRIEQEKKTKEIIQSIDEIIPGQKINKQTKEKIEEAIFKPVKTVNGKSLNAIALKRAENPVKFDAVVAYLILTGAFDGKWEKVQTSMKSKVVDDLKNTLKQNKSGEFRSVNNAQDITQTEKDNLESMKSLF